MAFDARQYVEVWSEDASRASDEPLLLPEDRSVLRRHWPAVLAAGGLLGATALLAPFWAGARGYVTSGREKPFLVGLQGDIPGPSGAAPPSNSFIVPLPPAASAPEPGAPEQGAADGGAADGGACASPSENCWITRCCSEPTHKCYMKDKDWAGCMEADTCVPGIHQADPDFARTDWNCFFVPASGDAIPPSAPAAPAPAPAPEPSQPVASSQAEMGVYPTLFCFQIIRVDSYELDVVKKQRELGASTFGCESSQVLSDNAVDLGGGVSTLEIGDLSTGSGVKTHFANTDIFSRAFDLLKEKGEILNHDFIVKVDPDAVFLPAKLKERITLVAPQAQGGGNIYFQNCHFNDKDWMFGAIEVLSKAALNAYYGGRDSTCRYALDYDNMGEDTFLYRCLDQLGVQPVADYDLLADGYCSEAPGDCRSNQAAYHPFKDPTSWEVCFKAASER